MRDPIHGYFKLNEYEFIEPIIASEYFQRLRRIGQLGCSFYVYPSAIHNRFSHSIGATQVFWRLFDGLRPSLGVSKRKAEELRALGTAAMLLHDIGHGPLSHVSEKIFDFRHEDLSKEIMMKTEIADILKRNGIRPPEVARIIDRTVGKDQMILPQLISSQLDADRLDYLKRDAYFTGVGFGNVDLDRISNVLIVHKGDNPLNGLAILLNKGYHAVESYIVTRHLMYQGIYFHKTTRGIEILIRKAVERMVKEERDIPSELVFLTQKRGPDRENMLPLDDYYFFSLFRKWLNSSDPILRDLSSRIINRHPFSAIEIPPKRMATMLSSATKIERILKRNRYDPQYFSAYDDPSDTPYKTYEPSGQDDKPSGLTNIFALDELGDPKEISQISAVVHSISKTQYSHRFYCPKEIREEVFGVFKKDK